MNYSGLSYRSLKLTIPNQTIMNILLIEDEKLAAEKLNNLLDQSERSTTVLATLDSVDSAIDWLNTNDCPDLIITDIHLIDGLCFNIFDKVQVKCPIVFATAYEKYAIQAFEVNSIDYLLKPIEQERLDQALEKFEQINSERQEDRTELYQEFKRLLAVKERNYKSRFLCKLGNKIKSVPAERIAYFYSKDKMTFLVDDQKQRFPVNNTLDEIDQLVDPINFFRINRKYITNYSAISEISPYFKGRLKLKLNPSVDDDIVVSTEKSPIFKAWLDR